MGTVDRERELYAKGAEAVVARDAARRRAKREPDHGHEAEAERLAKVCRACRARSKQE